MKKMLIAAGIAAVASVSQSFAQQGVHLGVTSGYYRTFIIDKGLIDGSSYDFASTFKAAPVGLAVGYQWETDNTRTGLQLEVIKANMGQKLDIMTRSKPAGPFIKTGSKEINLDYIQIPLLFKLASGEGKLKFSLVAGPQLSILSKGTDIETFTTDSISYTDTNNEVVNPVKGKEYVIGSTEQDARYTFNKTALGAVVGLGVDYSFTDALYLSFMLRGGYNFTELREEASGKEKFVDTNANTTNPGAPAAGEHELYKRELRNTGFGGVQVGLHYFFGQ